VKLAREGYRSSPYMTFIVDLIKDDLALFPETAKTYLPGNKVITPGTLVRIPEYAETLDKIAKLGSDSLYKGELGKQVEDYMEENGGLITMRDLKDYKLIMRDPIVGKYRDDYEIYAMAPGSSGGTHIIQMLNILESFDLASFGFGSVEHLHLMAEALKIVFADRQRYMGDPGVVDIPLTGLMAKEYAELRANEIEGKAKKYNYGNPDSYQPNSAYTTHVSTMDVEGNIVAATQTINNAYGSCVTVPGNGILLNDCMALFDPRPNRANSVAPSKRMLSSMSPTILLRRGKPYLCIGTPGGLRIFPSVTQALVNIIDFKMGIQEAVEAPRIWTMGIDGTPGENLHIESIFPEETKTSLEKRGHKITVMNRIAGGMNGVLRESTGLLHGGACWRADGTAMGMSGGNTLEKLLRPNPLV
jgi:gamma-glutamyltranspeptidase/glutathione hydrolase